MLQEVVGKLTDSPPSEVRLDPDFVNKLASLVQNLLMRTSLGEVGAFPGAESSVNPGSSSALPSLADMGRFSAPLSAPVQSSPVHSVPGHLAPPVMLGGQPVVAAVPPKSDDPSFESIIQKASAQYGVDDGLIRAVIQVESSGDPQAVSRVGAQGLMQLMPATAKELGVENAFDPEQNIMAGSRYLKKLLDRYDGKVDLALAGYNWGMGNLERRPEAMPQETKNYITKVNRLLGEASA